MQTARFSCLNYDMCKEHWGEGIVKRATHESAGFQIRSGDERAGDDSPQFWGQNEHLEIHCELPRHSNR